MKKCEKKVLAIKKSLRQLNHRTRHGDDVFNQRKYMKNKKNFLHEGAHVELEKEFKERLNSIYWITRYELFPNQRKILIFKKPHYLNKKDAETYFRQLFNDYEDCLLTIL